MEDVSKLLLSNQMPTVLIALSNSILCASWLTYLLGFGLFINLDEHSSQAKQQIYQLIAGMGLGALFQTPLIGLQVCLMLTLCGMDRAN